MQPYPFCHAWHGMHGKAWGLQTCNRARSGKSSRLPVHSDSSCLPDSATQVEGRAPAGLTHCAAAMGKRWIPLESNPVVLNEYAKKLGFDTSKYAFCDILGLDEVCNTKAQYLLAPSFTMQAASIRLCLWKQQLKIESVQELLAMVPSPVVAVVMLFPVTDKIKAIRDEGVSVLLRFLRLLKSCRRRIHSLGIKLTPAVLLMQRIVS